MRCEDLKRELAAPTGLLTARERDDHLADCPACAEDQARSARFERIWEATRPPEPSAQALDALWARASMALDAPKPGVIPFSKPWAARSRIAVAAFFAAQAAAVLVAASVLFRGGAEVPVAPVAVAPPTRVIANVDQTVIVRIDDDGHRVEILDESGQFAFASMADATPHDVFSALESLATK